ncbi:MAG: ADP-dependent NAD(P)H-hydrate dehydratase [Microbacteriaceae bacterium]
MRDFDLWTADDAALQIAVPGPHDDKYSRGVLGVVTGSDQYPGAAVLTVEAALRTGVGMVRYLGPERATQLVLQRRPEAVAGDGRVQAWLLGSGTDHAAREEASLAQMRTALDQGVPVVLDGGALELHGYATGPVVITPHAGELARLLGIEREAVTAKTAVQASRELGVVVLLKGHDTYAVGGSARIVASCAPSWLATAGAGDALAGILGALVATHSRADDEQLARLAAASAVIHGRAAERASAGGPFTILDLTENIPATIAEILHHARA